MKRFLSNLRRRIVIALSPSVKIDHIHALIKDSFLAEMGWFESRACMKPIDIGGGPLPWFVYSAITFLEKKLHLHPGLSVIEFGSGGSTVWLSNKVKNITSVETDFEWANWVSQRLPTNATLIRHEAVGDKPYDSMFSMGQKYDIIIIDGRRRNHVMRGVDHLAHSKSVIILDNSERDYYEPGRQAILALGYRELVFSGMGPVVPYGWSTSFFYKDGNVLGI